MSSFFETLQESTAPYIVVQAFAVPDPVENGKSELRQISHEGVCSSSKDVISLIRNSVVDPITGAISVKLLEIGRAHV